jgi:CheY-like chemotaxis protein
MAQPKPRPGIRILIVDDNQDSADSQAQVLRAMGHQAEVAYSGKAALEQAAVSHPQLFLLDLALPDIDGYELMRRLRPDHRTARFVALTGFTPDSGGNVAAKLFDEYVVKPMTPDILDEILERVTEGSGPG